MQGDTLVIEEYHRQAAESIARQILSDIEASGSRYTISVAGESGSGKSETAAALAEALAENGIRSVILQQDDYFVYPPHSNDRQRRKDISWVGTQEVKLELMDSNLKEFLDGKQQIEKPLVMYEDDKVVEETMSTENARVAIAEGTYTSLLNNINTRIFIDRNYLDTRAHREKRNRHASELDSFTDKVLTIEHDVISQHRARADIIINKDYSVAPVKA